MAVTLSGRGRTLAGVVSRLGNASLRISRAHSVKDRDAAQPVGAVKLSGAHAEAATVLTLKAADSGPLRGTIPEGLVLTINAVPHTTQAKASASSNTIAVTVAPGLATAQSDGADVTLAAKVEHTYASVHVRPASESEQVKAQTMGREIQYKVRVPAGSTWIEPGDKADVTFTNGAPSPIERVEATDTVSWGQVVYA